MNGSGQSSPWKKWWRSAWFSPRGFVFRAVWIALAFLVCEIADLREYTGFLSWTTVSSNLGWTTSELLGFIYIAACLAFVTVDSSVAVGHDI